MTLYAITYTSDAPKGLPEIIIADHMQASKDSQWVIFLVDNPTRIGRRQNVYTTRAAHIQECKDLGTPDNPAYLRPTQD